MRPPPAPRPNLAPKVYPDVEPGDHVYFHHPQRGPMSARVLATGKHGLTATCPLGDLYRVHWQRVLGVKERMQRPFKLVENGAEGFILEDDQGVRRYVAHDPKGDDEPDDEPPANPPRNRKKKLEKSLPAKGHALLLKTFIQGYVKQDGTTVRAHSDKRPPAHDAQDTAQALGGDLTGSAIPNDLVPVTGLNLLDQIIHDHADLARVCQAYRNPFYETFRVFYVRKGIIVGQCGLSARMPSTTPVPRGYEIEVRQQAERLKAEQIWLVHNHPSGDPEPSQADIRYTFEAEQALPQFAGHVIINNGKYSAYSPKTGWTINIPFKQPGILEDDIGGGIVTYNLENSGNFGKQHQWLMKAPEDDPGVLAKIAKHAATAPDNLVLTSLVKLPGKIRAIAELPRNSLEDPERAALRAKLRSATGEFITRQRETVMAYLRLFARQTGATQGMILFCPHARREDYAWLCEANVLRDVLSVDEDGHLRSVAADFPDLIDPAKGAWIGVDQPKTELVEEFFSRMGYDEPPTPALRKAQPTPAQIEAGNYQKQHRRFQGLDISIENPAGSVRKGIDRDGHEWRTRMRFDYGYIRGSKGVDKDHVDCYLGPHEAADFAYIVHQRKAGQWDRFDEDKVMLGFKTQKAARRAYLAHYDDPRFLGDITSMPMEEFKIKVRATAHRPAMIKALPATVRLLLFKAFQPGLFDAPVTVSGHVTKRGTVVAPYQATRKKRPEPPSAPDLFAEADRKEQEADERRRAEEEKKAQEEAERLAKEEAERQARKDQKTPSDDADDPNSPNYRFRDTGYIAGSRKEEAANLIRRAGREGRRLNPTDIDWQQIEQNPREAKELITKSNLFGTVDWEALKAEGMEPGAGFLIDRVYASISQEPTEDRQEARQRYALGLQSLRDRLEACKTPSAVTAALNDMRAELEGTMLTAEQTAELQPLIAATTLAWNIARNGQKEIQKRWDNYYRLDNDLKSLNYDQEKRTRRGWKPDPELAQKITDLEAEVAAAHQEWQNYRADHPEAVEVTHIEDLGDGRKVYSTYSPLMDAYRKLKEKEQQIRARYKAQNTLSNPLFAAWVTLGERFLKVLRYRSHQGSEAFKEHVASALAGKITDWSWAEKTTTTAPKTTQGETAFALKVIDRYERVGGRPVRIGSTAALKQEFSLRDVQSGNWVLDDPTSAQWHVQQAAEAFADLADLLGVPDSLISMNGRLALAFGARGKGNLGFGGAARAHYEAVQRVINITKMGGGGCLAHEWFHALDNLMVEAETGQPAGKEVYATETPAALPGDLKDALAHLTRTMTAGTRRLSKTYEYTSLDVKTAALNLKPRPGGYGTPKVVSLITNAANVHEAVQLVENYFEGQRPTPRTKKLAKEWRQIAIAHYGGDPNGGTLAVEAGETRSEFAHHAVLLDKGVPGKYWSSTRELAARAFQSYVEDTLARQQRRSDYLSAGADNRIYLGDKPFPEGEERTRINAAFDRLIGVMRQRRTLEKAFRQVRYFFLKAAP